MVKLLDEHERTMAFAEVALGQIKSLRQTAVPRNYEIWYVYATGYNAPLNKIINETLARNGRLSEADLEQIYETYLSQIKTSERIDKVGARVIGEIDDVMNLIAEALNMSVSYDATLGGASQKLSTTKNPDQIKAVVDPIHSKPADKCKWPVCDATLTTRSGTKTRKPHAALRPMPTRTLKNVSIQLKSIRGADSGHQKDDDSFGHSWPNAMEFNSRLNVHRQNQDTHRTHKKN